MQKAIEGVEKVSVLLFVCSNVTEHASFYTPLSNN